MTTLVHDSTRANVLDLDSMQHGYTFNADGTLATETVTDGANTWKKTYTYTSGNLTNETMWVKQ